MPSTGYIELVGVDNIRTEKIPNSNNFNVYISLSTLAPDEWRESLRISTQHLNVTVGDDHIVLREVPINDDTVLGRLLNSDGDGVIDVIGKINGRTSHDPGQGNRGNDEDQKRQDQTYLDKIDQFIKNPHNYPTPAPTPAIPPTPNPSPSTPPVVSSAFYSRNLTLGPIDKDKSVRRVGDNYDIYLPLSEKAPEYWVEQFNDIIGGSASETFNALATQDYVKLSTPIDEDTFSMNVEKISSAFWQIASTNQKSEDAKDWDAQQLRPKLIALDALFNAVFYKYR